MPREKKRLSYTELEEHVTAWVVNQIELLRGMVDEINDDSEIPEEHRIVIFDGIATQFQELLDLMSKINNDERPTLDWAQNFIGRYQLRTKMEN